MASHIVESTNGLPTFWPSLRSFQGIGLVQFESKYWDYFQTNSFHIGICSLAVVLLYFFYKVLSHNKRLCWIAYFTSAYSRPHVQDLKSSFVFISPTLNQAALLSNLTAKYPSCSLNGFVNEPCVNGWLNGDVKWSSWCLKWLTTKINRSSLVLVDCGDNASMYFSQKVQWCRKRLYIMTSCAIHVYIYVYISWYITMTSWSSWLASQITGLTLVYSTVYSRADQRKHQSSESLAFVWGIHRWPGNSSPSVPVTRKMFPFDVVIIEISSEIIQVIGSHNERRRFTVTPTLISRVAESIPRNVLAGWSLIIVSVQ